MQIVLNIKQERTILIRINVLSHKYETSRPKCFILLHNKHFINIKINFNLCLCRSKLISGTAIEQKHFKDDYYESKLQQPQT